MDAGELDLVLAKRPAGDDRGQLVWRDRLAWIGAPGARIDLSQPVPLILYNAPSITRSVALETLERHGLTWRIACTSSSLSGVRAAALAGLGVAVHARGLIPDGLVEMSASCRLPELAEVEFVVTAARTGQRGPAAALAEAILANRDRTPAGSLRTRTQFPVDALRRRVGFPDRVLRDATLRIAPQ